MFKYFALLFLVIGLGCGEEKVDENPTTCKLTQLENGVQFDCIDKDGQPTTGVVENGKQGAQGEKGEVGQPGNGLVVAQSAVCKGSVEGWLENSSYQIEFQYAEFETGDKFVSSMNKLMRADEVINARSASGFFLSGHAAEITDGVLMMKYAGEELLISSKGGLSAKIPCEVK